MAVGTTKSAFSLCEDPSEGANPERVFARKDIPECNEMSD